MADDARLLTLLETILESGRSPEEVCRDCPELLPAVRERLQGLHVVRAQVAELFPTPPPPAPQPTTAPSPRAPAVQSPGAGPQDALLGQRLGPYLIHERVGR